MKIAVTSDIHLEFGHWTPVNPDNADVLILGGDIMLAHELGNAVDDWTRIVPRKGHKFYDFLVECKSVFPNVIYVMGNHEHYNGDYAKSSGILKKVCVGLDIHFLDKETVTIDDVMFIGGTLWTDMNNEDPLTLYHVKGCMNDFQIVKNSNRNRTYKVPVYKKDEDGHYLKDDKGMLIEDRIVFKEEPSTFCPEDALEDHKKMMGYLKVVLEGKHNQKVVVCGHHAPSKQSTKPRYKDDVLMNGAYSSDLTDFILDHPQIKLWTHGHTHDVFDYMVGSTRIVCNPRGYVNYERGSNEAEPYFPMTVEV
jgi:predicted phosphodiesterase